MKTPRRSRAQVWKSVRKSMPPNKKIILDKKTKLKTKRIKKVDIDNNEI